MAPSREAPFHDGERRAQALAGEEVEARHNGRAIASLLVPGAVPFVAAQPLVVVAHRDDGGRPWATALFGPPGFVTATRDAVALDLTRVLDPGAAAAALRPGSAVGLLFIEPFTRRRLRVNGTCEPGEGLVSVRVREAFPNCPRFITRRVVTIEPGAPAPPVAPPERTPAVVDLAAWLARADTLFVASGHPDRGLDASHRGGPPGFASLDADGAVLVPDYPGNSMFTTLGNLLVDPRAGLLVLDFAGGRALALTGEAEVVWSGPDPEGRTGGTGRWWRLRPGPRPGDVREVALPPSARSALQRAASIG